MADTPSKKTNWAKKRKIILIASDEDTNFVHGFVSHA